MYTAAMLSWQVDFFTICTSLIQGWGCQVCLFGNMMRRRARDLVLCPCHVSLRTAARLISLFRPFAKLNWVLL